MSAMSDLISRQDAIDAMKKYEELESNNFTDTSPIGMMTVATIANCIEEIVNLPSAEPERKKGKWIEEDLSGYFTPGGNSIYHCSECGHTEGPWPHPRLTNFCPNCGAEMEKTK